MLKGWIIQSEYGWWQVSCISAFRKLHGTLKLAHTSSYNLYEWSVASSACSGMRNKCQTTLITHSLIPLALLKFRYRPLCEVVLCLQILRMPTLKAISTVQQNGTGLRDWLGITSLGIYLLSCARETYFLVLLCTYACLRCHLKLTLIITQTMQAPYK